MINYYFFLSFFLSYKLHVQVNIPKPFFIQKTDLKYIKFLNVLFIKPKPGT